MLNRFKNSLFRRNTGWEMNKGSLWPKNLWQLPKPGSSVIALIEAKFDCVLFDQIEVADCVFCFVLCTIETSQVHCPFPSAHWRFNLELIVGDKQTPALRLSTFGTETSIKPSFPHFWFPSVSWIDLAFKLLYSRDWFWFWTNMWVRIKLTSYASLAYSTF